MTKTMNSWFFMRDGFETFRLEPERHRKFLFGSTERRQRDYLMGEIEGAGYSSEGHKAVVFGDYGRGKTHMCHNLCFEIEAAHSNVLPIYIKCSAYTAKEPFQSLFREIVTRIPTQEMGRVATEYARRVQRKEAPELVDIVQSEDIALVMSKGLSAVDHDSVRNCMRWLGGEPKVPMGLISQSLKPQLDDGQEFGSVLRGLVHMFRTVDGKVILYLVDEAERFENVTNVDTFARWLAAMRELTEIIGVGLILFVGAKKKNDLPTILVQDEIVRRIGVANYTEFQNPSRDALKDFIGELLSTMIQKGDVPEAHRAALPPEALSGTVPDALQELTGNDPQRLAAYPFEPDALAEFVEQVAAGDLTNKPSEVLVRMQKAAQRAMRNDARTIDSRVVEAISAEGF
jgi:hypothetical protein